MNSFINIASSYMNRLHMPTVRWTDIVEILIISFLAYEVFLWVRNTRAWVLLRGLFIILALLLAAVLLNMTTILWIAENVLSLSVIAIIVVLQPELRRALESLGRNRLFAALMPDTGRAAGNISDKTIQELVHACFEMGRARTGALIVIQNHSSLDEYVNTGIEVDGIITSQLLINIFEHNTPLHDGAVVIINDRIKAATCYLPLSDNRDLSKELGTRHRAGVGVSEQTDSLTLIVSEETGRVSCAFQGEITGGLEPDTLREKLIMIQDKPREEKKNRIWRAFNPK